MPRRILVYILLVIVTYTANAQKPLGRALEIKTFIYTDDYAIGSNNWAYLFKEGHQPLVKRSDTLLFGSEGKGGAFPAFNNGWGIRADLVKGFFPSSTTKHARMDWALGVGYRRYITKDRSIPYDDYRDTAIVYHLNSLSRSFTQQYADLQTRAVYKLMDESGTFGLYLGFALQASLPFAGSVQEDFMVKEARWSATGRSWIETPQADLHQSVPAKRISYFSWGVPVGLFIRLSDNWYLLPEISYWHNTNRKYFYSATYIGNRKTFSESGYLTIGARYSW